MEKSVGRWEISFPSSDGRCLDMAFSRSLTDVASEVSGIIELDNVLVMSRSEGTVAAGFDVLFRLSSSLSGSSSQSVVCFRFFILLAGIGDVLS